MVVAGNVAAKFDTLTQIGNKGEPHDPTLLIFFVLLLQGRNFSLIISSVFQRADSILVKCQLFIYLYPTKQTPPSNSNPFYTSECGRMVQVAEQVKPNEREKQKGQQERERRFKASRKASLPMPIGRPTAKLRPVSSSSSASKAYKLPSKFKDALNSSSSSSLSGLEKVNEDALRRNESLEDTGIGDGGLGDGGLGEVSMGGMDLEGAWGEGMAMGRGFKRCEEGECPLVQRGVEHDEGIFVGERDSWASGSSRAHAGGRRFSVVFG